MMIMMATMVVRPQMALSVLPEVVLRQRLLLRQPRGRAYPGGGQGRVFPIVAEILRWRNNVRMLAIAASAEVAEAADVVAQIRGRRGGHRRRAER